MTEDRPSLGAVVGKNIRQMRTDAGMTADELATRLRFFGLNWTRSTLTSLERGTKVLEATELIGLMMAFGFSPDLILAGEEEIAWGQIGMDLPAVRRHLTAKSPDPWPLVLDPATGRARERFYPNETDLVSDQEQIPRAGEAEMKAARKLNVPVTSIIEASMSLWNATLTEERENRVLPQIDPETTPRSLQAIRGSVTRALLKELGPAVEEIG